MPLRLIECVLPWLVGSLNEEEARFFLKNMHMAGSLLISYSLKSFLSLYKCMPNA